jgi:iron complex outermembrane receptor protein
MGLEGGFTWDRPLARGGTTTLQVIGFRHQLDDAVVRITLQNPTRFQRINRDRIESAGAEILGGVVFGADPERAVSLNGDATIQSITIFDATANDAQRRAENNPERRGRLELGVPLPADLRAFVTGRYTGTQYCLNGDTSVLNELAGRTVADVAVQRTFTLARGGPFRMLRTLLAFDNIGDTTVYDQCGLPQPGRTVRLMVTMR